MRRFGFRRLLPVLFTVVHVVFVIVDAKPHPSQTHVISVHREVAFQENTDVPFVPVRPKLLASQKAALILNLPALFVAIPVSAIFIHGNEFGTLYVATVFIPLLWYWIGRWLDVQVGYLKPRVKPDSSLRKTARIVAAILSSFFLLIYIASVTPLNHHRGSESIWFGAAGIFWSGLVLAMSISGIRNRAQAERT